MPSPLTYLRLALWVGLGVWFLGAPVLAEEAFTPDAGFENRVLLSTSRFLEEPGTGAPLPPWLGDLELLPPGSEGMGWTYRINFLAAESGRLLCRIWHSGGDEGEALVVSSLDAQGRVIDLQLVELSGGNNFETGSEVVLELGNVSGAVAVEIMDSATEARVRQFELLRLALKPKWVVKDSKGSEVDTENLQAYSSMMSSAEDVSVRGSVAALLLEGPETLGGPESRVLPLEFELVETPEAAMLVLEISGVELDLPLECYVNDVRLRAISMALPGLGDPAYLQLTKPALEDPVLQFTGWVPSSAYVPSRWLRRGLNEILLVLPEGVSPAQVRQVGLHLKYHSVETQNKVLPVFYE